MEQSINRSTRPPYGIIAVLMIGAFIAFLNNTLLNVALPSMMRDLQVEPSTIQWLTTGYMLVNGVMIPTTAFLIEKYTVRRLFLVAMSLFTIGTIIAGTADVFYVLLAARMVQASGSAILMPLLMNVMLISFPIEKRGVAMGFFGLILMAAPAIGPTLSGWIVQQYDWRMLFHFLTPIAITVLLIGFFLLKDKKERTETHLDVLSVIYSSIGFGGLLYGFSSAGSKGWDSPLVYLPITLGVISLVLLVLRQARLEIPMLNFDVFKYPMFTLSSTISMVVNMAMFSGMLLLPIYVQNIRGISPMDAGFMLLPGALVMAFMSPVTGRLFDQFGGKILATVGLLIMTVTTYFFSQLTMDTGYVYLMVLHAIRMFGMSMVMMPVSTNGLNQLPTRLYPHGTAMNNTLNQVSGAIGTALLVTIMSTRTALHANELSKDMMGSLTGQQSEAALVAWKQQIEMQATLEGINDSFFVATCIASVAFILAFFIKRAKQEEDPIKRSSKDSSNKKMPKLAEAK